MTLHYASHLQEVMASWCRTHGGEVAPNTVAFHPVEALETAHRLTAIAHILCVGNVIKAVSMWPYHAINQGQIKCTEGSWSSHSAQKRKERSWFYLHTVIQVHSSWLVRYVCGNFSDHEEHYAWTVLQLTNNKQHIGWCTVWDRKSFLIHTNIGHRGAHKDLTIFFTCLPVCMT